MYFAADNGAIFDSRREYSRPAVRNLFATHRSAIRDVGQSWRIVAACKPESTPRLTGAQNSTGDVPIFEAPNPESIIRLTGAPILDSRGQESGI